jgi:hypothetical protein
MELIIPEKYLIRWEGYTKFTGNHCVDIYATRYVFAVPEVANLEPGYTFYIDTNDRTRENGKLVCCGQKREHYSGAYHLHVPEYPKGFTYTALKTENREEGKKYKRYTFSGLELQALYNGHKLSDGISAVAKVKFYAKSGYLSAKEVIREDYIVGKRIGCWFYSDEFDTKRRVGTKGVSILGEIEEEHEATIRQLIEAYKAQNKAISQSTNQHSYNLSMVESICREIIKINMSDDDLLQGKVEDIRNRLNKLKAACFTVVEQDRKRHESNEKELLESLKKYYKVPE